MIKNAFFGNLVRRGRIFAGLLTIGAALAATSERASAADVWSGNCTPDIIQIFPNTLVARCQQTGVWYEMSYTNPARSEAYIDRIIRALEAAQLSGKWVQFRDVGTSPIGAHAFDAVALNR